MRKFKQQRRKNEKAKLDEDSAEHKFTGPKREPTIVESSPPKRLEKLPGEPIIKKGRVSRLAPESGVQIPVEKIPKFLTFMNFP